MTAGPRSGGFPVFLGLGLITAAVTLSACSDARGWAPGAGSGASEAPPPVTTALQARLDSLSDPTLDSIYGSAPSPLWLDGTDGLDPIGEEALERMSGVRSDGLDPDEYGWSAARRLDERDDLTPHEAAELETTVTTGLALLRLHLLRGRVATTDHDPGWKVDSLEAAGLPDSVRAASEVIDALDDLRPTVAQYDRLLELRARLVERARDGGWPTVDDDAATFEVGDSTPTVAQVRARLLESLSAEERRLAGRGEDRPARADSALIRSLSLFQDRHDLKEDGILGSETVGVMNIPVEERITGVSLALERWRWLPRELGSAAVLVNTPGLRVHVMEDGRAALSMKVIVGQRDWATTLFQDAMERLVVNPYWNVPENILEEETLPKAKDDPSYLRDNGFEVVDPESGDVIPLSEIDWGEAEAESFPYRIRQAPGESNALGEVKFLFPNRFAIYLHDTPADHLFDERVRTFSHGCIRVERPRDLAHHILETATDLPVTRYDSLRATGDRHVIELDRHLPTYVIYQTVWVDRDGVPTFSPDIYDRDASARAVLPTLRISESRP